MSSIKTKNLKKTLVKFYSQPVAKVSLEFFLSLFTIIFFAIFAIRPTILIIADLINEIEEKQNFEQQLQRKIAALATAQEEYQLLQEKVVFLDQAVPSRSELIKSLKTIEKIAADEKVLISNLKTSTIPDDKVPTTLSSDHIARIDLYITLQAMGDYPALKNFVASLREYRRAFVIEEINFNIDDRVNQQILKVNLSIRVPYFGEKNAQSIQRSTR